MGAVLVCGRRLAELNKRRNELNLSTLCRIEAVRGNDVQSRIIVDDEASCADTAKESMKSELAFAGKAQ